VARQTYNSPTLGQLFESLLSLLWLPLFTPTFVKPETFSEVSRIVFC